MKARILFLLIAFAMAMSVKAQPKELAKFFPAAAVPSGGQTNLDYLIGGYVGPLAEDLGGLLNSGWYNTAENHKKFGFDLSVTVTTIFVGDASKSFAVNNGQLTGVGYLGTTNGPGTPMATAYGAGTTIPAFTINTGSNIGNTFNGPGGGNISDEIPIGSMAVPTIQGGLGLFKNTDLRFRFAPATKVIDTEVQNWGVGLMHDIKQHIPGLKELPFSLSILLAYSNMTATTNLGGIYETSSGSGSYAGQEGVGETTAFTAQVLVAKQIPVLTFYAGLGYNSGTTKFDVKGNYFVNQSFDASLPLVTPVALSNPFSKEYSTSGFCLTGGIRFKFGPVFLNSNYTLYGGEGLLNLGFGFTVR